MSKTILIDRLENQISAMLDTIVEIDKEEQKEPIRELTEWHKTALGMTFFSQVLMKSCWNTILKDKRLTPEQSLEYITEVAEMTKEHYKNLYGFDSLKSAKNS